MLMACGGASDDSSTAANLPKQLAGQQTSAVAAPMSSSTAGTAEAQADAAAESTALSVASTVITLPASATAAPVEAMPLPVAPALAATTTLVTTAPVVVSTPIISAPITTPPIASTPTTTTPIVTTASMPPPAATVTLLSAEQTCNQTDFQRTITNLINQARASNQMCGTTSYPAVAPLAWNTKLFNAAAGHSADMASQNYFSHTSLDGRTPGQRMTNAGYNWSSYGENIAMGQSSIASVMDTWMKSAGHCANIMNARLTEVAVACVKNSSSRNYWTMDLGRPR